MIKKYFIPDLMFDDFTSVTPELLKKLGINALICDIDNTLAAYEQIDPPDNVLHWCKVLENNSIKISFVSNNNKERVERFNKKFGYPAYFNSIKPSRKFIFAAMKEMNASKSETAVVGDQILTDVLAAKRAGLTAIAVKPIKDKKTLFFKFKRILEKPFIKEYRRMHKNENNGN